MADTPHSTYLLVVDDDRGLLRLMERALTREGHVVMTAQSGSEAIETALHSLPALMVLDLKLGDMEGIEVVNRLRGNGSTIPFIVVTGQGDERVAVDMMKRGALDYLVKDFRFQESLPAVVARGLKQIEQIKKLNAAEEALDREIALTQAIFDSSGGLLMVLDGEQRIVRFNRACERLSGYTFAEVVGRRVWEFLGDPDDANLLRHALQGVDAMTDSREHESKWVTKPGDRRLIAWSENALRHPTGGLAYVIASGVDITERKRLEQELLNISEMEQRRLGQDLHDGLCQHLAGIEFMSQVLQQKLASKARVEAARAEEIARLVRDAISQTRDLAHGLSPVTLEAEGLMAALQSLVGQTEHRFGIHCQFVCPQPVLVPDNATATHLYRIAQESVSNAIRHGKARHVTVTLELAGGRILLHVADDGMGLEKSGSESKGMGLHIMKYRADTMGGSLDITPRMEGGTVVTCSVRHSCDSSPTDTST